MTYKNGIISYIVTTNEKPNGIRQTLSLFSPSFCSVLEF